MFQADNGQKRISCKTIRISFFSLSSLPSFSSCPFVAAMRKSKLNVNKSL